MKHKFKELNENGEFIVIREYPPEPYGIEISRRKIAMIAVFFLAFSMLSSGVFALRFDLQPYTTCILGSCSTSLDVSTLGLSQNKINALKTVNITNFLNKSGIINNFAYSWNGNTVTITGSVTSNVYWSFSAGGDSFDPFWNVTVAGWGNGEIWDNTQTLGSIGASAGYWRGGNITTKNRIHITNFTYSSIVGGCNNATIVNASSKAIIESGSINDVTKVVTFTTNDLPNASAFYVLINCTNRSMVSYSSPQSVGGFTYSQSFIYTNDFVTISAGANEYEQIETIGWQNYSTTNVSYLYDLELYLNGTQANITIPSTQTLNISAGLIGNLTENWNLTLYVNNSVYNVSLNNVTNRTKLPVGTIPITVSFPGNASISGLNKTFYATVTAPPTDTSDYVSVVIDLNDAPLYCLDNFTAARNSTFINNGNVTPLSESYNCPFGCDTATNTGCKRDPLQQGLINFGFVVAFILILIILDKVLRR